MRLPMLASVCLVALLAGTAWAQDPPTRSRADAADQTGYMDTQDTPTAPVADPAPSTSKGAKMDVPAMVGRTVYDRDGKIGRVEDVVLDTQTGQIREFVVGLDNNAEAARKMVAVDVEEVAVRPDLGIRLLSLTRADVVGMPDFSADGSAVSLQKRTGAPATGSETSENRVPTEPERKP